MDRLSRALTQRTHLHLQLERLDDAQAVLWKSAISTFERDRPDVIVHRNSIENLHSEGPISKIHWSGGEMRKGKYDRGGLPQLNILAEACEKHSKQRSPLTMQKVVKTQS